MGWIKNLTVKQRKILEQNKKRKIRRENISLWNSCVDFAVTNTIKLLLLMLFLILVGWSMG